MRAKGSSPLRTSPTATRTITMHNGIPLLLAAIAAPVAANPFQEGCLRHHLPARGRRVCHSEDVAGAAAAGKCDAPPFDYPEVRIQNQNWLAPMFSAWILQILLSELLGVPATIETSAADRGCDFYSPTGRCDSSTATYNYESLQTAKEYGDCRKAKLEGYYAGEYKTCAHVFPMVNKVGQSKELAKMFKKGTIQQPRDSGQADQYRWWVPKMFAMQEPCMLTHYGIAREQDRRLLAEKFKRPTDWGTYCAEVSANNCLGGDGVATRPPTEDEAEKYFDAAAYTGHFRYTEKNNCTANPDTCSGHIANVPCTWSNYAVAQAHHLGIAVESDGEMNGRYGYSSLLEIYDAANATKSNVMMNWWEPDVLVERFRGTDFEMVPVLLTPTTAECVENRVTAEQRCSDNFTTQVGSPKGACGTDLEMNAMVTTLDPCSHDEADCSPAYAMLQLYQITSLDMQQLYKASIDSTDDRTAVCNWLVNNLDKFEQTVVPQTYPRTMRQGSFYQPYMKFALFLAVMTAILVLLCAFASKYYQKTKVMVYAQVDFLLIILSGLFMVALAAVLHSITPTNGLCTATTWFVALGYSLELIPLAVKVSAVNRLFQLSRSFRRVTITKKKLYKRVGGCCMVVCVFLATWTGVDPAIVQTLLTLNDEDGRFVAETINYCASSYTAWYIALSAYILVLLLVSAAIATQNRGIKEEFNESRYMALMLYSHLMFTLLRLAIFFVRDRLNNPTAVAATNSLLLSMDTLITLCIYFLPKIVSAWNLTREARDKKRKQKEEEITRRTAGNTANDSQEAEPEPASDTNRRDSLKETTDQPSFTWAVSRKNSLGNNTANPNCDTIDEEKTSEPEPASDTNRRDSLKETADQSSFTWTVSRKNSLGNNTANPNCDTIDEEKIAEPEPASDTNRRDSLKETADQSSFTWTVSRRNSLGDNTANPNCDTIDEEKIADHLDNNTANPNCDTIDEEKIADRKAV